MKTMSLIDVFENKLTQDVKTFNLIFKQTKIRDFPSDASVEIKELHAEDKRRILVGEDVIFLRIVQVKRKRKTKKKQERKYILKREKSSPSPVVLPDIFIKLKPTEFMVFQAIKLLGKIDSIEELSKQISICSKTIGQVIKKLIKTDMITADKISLDGKPLLRLGLTQKTIDANMFLQ